MINTPAHILRFTVVVLFIPVFMGADLSPEEFSRNKKALERIKRDPLRHDKLRQNYETWLKMDQAARNEIRSFDKQIHDPDPVKEARNIELVRRFHAWMSELPEPTRAEILLIENEDAKIAKIKSVMEKLWVERLPKGERELLAGLDADARKAELIRIKGEELQRHSNPESKKKKKFQIRDLSQESRDFVEKLKAQLNTQDLERINKADYKKAAVFKIIGDLSENYPLLPKKVDKPEPPLRLENLPDDVRGVLKSLRQMEKGRGSDVMKAEGKWPAFPLVVTRLMRTVQPDYNGNFGASTMEEFPSEAQAVILNSLFPIISQEEKAALDDAQGKWPDYPLLLRKIANDRFTYIPGLSLPPEIQSLRQAKPPMMR